MTFTSFFYFLFLIIIAIVYFFVPLSVRWIVLLAGSLFFYATAGLVFLPYLLFTVTLSFGTALILGKLDRKAKRKLSKLILVISIVIIVGYLACTKYIRFFSPGSSLIVPLGLSYYTFSVVGYLLDVYWLRYPPEKNFFKYLLYISFFPHILQGPIPRYNKLAAQLTEGHKFSYERVTFGAQRMLFGLFQKLVLADRLGVFVDNVFSRYDKRHGPILIIAVFFYAIQLYTDFAGCVNLAAGSAQIFGIELEENFRQPYFSKSVEEFWRRWHITLGHWFRDYVGMPVSTSKTVKTLSGKIWNKYGREAGKNTISLSALFFVWLCTGLWHGTGVRYMLWAAWQGGIIAIGILFKKHFTNIKNRLHITKDSKGFAAFQILRTFILAGIIPRVITRAPSATTGFLIFRNMFHLSGADPLWFKDGYFYGWTELDALIVSIAILIQLMISILKERNIQIRAKISTFILPIRWLIYMSALYIVLIFGKYGPGFNAGSFVYMGF